MSGMATHDLNHLYPMVRARRGAHLLDYTGTISECRIKPQCVVGVAEIFINGFRNPNYLTSFFTQPLCHAQRILSA